MKHLLFIGSAATVICADEYGFMLVAGETINVDPCCLAGTLGSKRLQDIKHLRLHGYPRYFAIVQNRSIELRVKDIFLYEGPNQRSALLTVGKTRLMIPLPLPRRQ